MKRVKVREQKGGFVVSFNDHDLIDDDLITEVAVELTEVLTSLSTGARLVLDFQNVRIMSSLMLGELVTLNKNGLRKRVILQFCRLSPDVERVIKGCQLHQLFEILDDLPV